MAISPVKLFAISAVLALVSGCSYHGAAMISSTPSGAEVVDVNDGTLLGVTPLKVWWKENAEERKFINIRVQKEGYADKTTSFWVTLRHNSRKSAMATPQSVEMNLDKNE